jgi:cytochrome c5
MDRYLILPRAAVLIPILTLLCACSEGSSPAPIATAKEESVGEAPAAPPAPQPENPILSGYEVYEDHCASCHDTGLGDAPVTGNPADWEDRSGLWVAVLAEHVKAGYLQMPARGGVSPLSDLSVTQAVEHMMLQTFPEKPAD